MACPYPNCLTPATCSLFGCGGGDLKPSWLLEAGEPGDPAKKDWKGAEQGVDFPPVRWEASVGTVGGRLDHAVLVAVNPACRIHGVDENACHGHVASSLDHKVCAYCGTHVDSLRPDDGDF